MIPNTFTLREPLLKNEVCKFASLNSVNFFSEKLEHVKIPKIEVNYKECERKEKRKGKFSTGTILKVFETQYLGLQFVADKFPIRQQMFQPKNSG